jgi:hypothetical protein
MGLAKKRKEKTMTTTMTMRKTKMKMRTKKRRRRRRMEKRIMEESRPRVGVERPRVVGELEGDRKTKTRTLARDVCGKERGSAG